MTKRQLVTNTITISILLLMLVAYQIADAAPPVRVESADPPEAEQATLGLNIVINGSGFDTEPGAVTSVEFLLPCNAEPCSDTGGVEVKSYTVQSRKKIVATVDVDELATVDYRDIEVRMTRGRGGKGTTLFRVREKNTGGQQFTTCSEAYFGGVSGICMDLNGGECDLRLGNPERIKLMTEDCVTSETIVLPTSGSISSDANIESEADYKTLTAIGSDFTGTALIANAGHRATVRALKLVIDSSVSNVGCDTGDLATAVRFVLDGYTDLPLPDDENRASVLYVNAVHISTEGAPLCEAIEVARRDAYTGNTFGMTNDWKTYVSGNHIAPLSYARTGIRFEGIKQQQAVNPPRVDNNVVGAPACNDMDGAVGIIHGPLIARDFDSQSDAPVEGNTVVMAGATCAETTGIKLVGRGDTDMNGMLNSNSVTGGRIGIRIDADAGTDRVNMKGNTLTGIDGDAGVCSNIPVGEKGKPNTISGYDTDFDAPPCDGL